MKAESRKQRKKTEMKAEEDETLARAPLLQAADTKRLRGGQAATVAGYAGPGFHTWPSGHILQDNGSESASTNPVTL